MTTVTLVIQEGVSMASKTGLNAWNRLEYKDGIAQITGPLRDFDELDVQEPVSRSYPTDRAGNGNGNGYRWQQPKYRAAERVFVNGVVCSREELADIAA